jgi:DNA-directed RNA polymerase subunit RPC12/RpoP
MILHAIRIRDIPCSKCGRMFRPYDVDHDAEGTIRLTCADCGDRPFEVETTRPKLPRS